MPDKIIAATLQVDTGTSNANIKEVNQNLTDVKGNLKDTSTTAKTAGKDIEGTGGSFSNLKDRLSEMPGPLGKAGEGVNSLSTAFKALLANPVGLVLIAIVGALTLLYKAFTNTFEGGQKMEQVFAGIKSAVEVVTDRVFALGNAVIKFFSGDFKGALTDAKAAVTGVGDEIGRVYQRTAELTKQLQGIRKEERQDEIDKSEREKRLALLREQLNDDSVPLQKRLALAKQLKDDEDKNAVDDIERSKRKAAIQIELLKQGTDGEKKHADEIAAIQVELNKTETENALEGVRTNRVIKSLEKQEESEQTAAYKEELEKRKKALAEYKTAQKKINDDGNKAIDDAEKVLDKSLSRGDELKKLKDDYDAKAALATKANLSALKIYEAYQAERAKLEKKYADEDTLIQTKAEKERDDFLKGVGDRAMARIAAQDAERAGLRQQEENDKRDKAELEKNRIEETKGVLNSLQDLVGKQTIAGKALGIATALINTYQGASEALKQKSTLPSPFDVIAKIANVAAIIATGLATVKAITSVSVPGGGSGGGSASPSVSVAAPVAPTQSSTRLDQASINQMGNSTVRAFIVDKDVQNNRERTERLNRQARLGG